MMRWNPFLRPRRSDHPSPEELSAYLDGQLDQTSRTWVDAHVRGCERCAREVASLRATVRLLAALPQVAAPRSFALRDDAIRSRRGVWWDASLRAAAAVAAVLFVVLGIVDAAQPSERQAVAPYAASAPDREGVPQPAAAPAALQAPSAPQQAGNPGEADTESARALAPMKAAASEPTRDAAAPLAEGTPGAALAQSFSGRAAAPGDEGSAAQTVPAGEPATTAARPALERIGETTGTDTTERGEGLPSVEGWDLVRLGRDVAGALAVVLGVLAGVRWWVQRRPA
jgi:hypothetical protein